MGHHNKPSKRIPELIFAIVLVVVLVGVIAWLNVG